MVILHKKIKVTKEMLPKYQLQIIEYKNFAFGKSKKFIPNLVNKKKYKIHYQNFKIYLDLGLQLNKNS